LKKETYLAGIHTTSALAIDAADQKYDNILRKKIVKIVASIKYL